MTFRTGLIAGIALTSTVVSAAMVWRGSGAAASKPAEKTTAATVTKVVKEDDLCTVRLTPAAAESLGIRTAKVERGAIEATRVYGGEIAIPAGHTVLVAAPFGGILKAPDVGMPMAGQAVARGQAILQLFPQLTPGARTTIAALRSDAEGQVENSTTQVEATSIALERAKRLFKNEAGSQRMVDEAQAAYDIARKTLEASQERLAILAAGVSDAEDGKGQPIAIDSPQDGILRSITALPGQNVPAGAPLFEVVDLSLLWVRVPVSVGDMQEIDKQATARVGSLTARPGDPSETAKVVAAPPSANPLTATVDVMYEVANTRGQFFPGERVGVTVPLRNAVDVLQAPWSSVVHDIHGGTWVYEQSEPLTFVRRRVIVDSVVGGKAILAAGPAVGTPLVADGAVELFGAETGPSK
jgi:membrane fusion protein, heavy metal efflux system